MGRDDVVARPLAWASAVLVSTAALVVVVDERTLGGLGTATLVGGLVLGLVAAVLRMRRLVGAVDEVRDALLAHTSHAMLLVDPAGRVVDVNTPAVAMLGYRRETLLGMGVEDLLPEEHRPHHPAHRAAYAATPRPLHLSTRGELGLRRADGEVMAVSMSLTPLPDARGGPPLVAVTVVDVSELTRKAADAERRARALEHTLEHEVASLAAMRDLDQAKDLLLSAISHEIRTPLTVLIGMTELLADVDRPLPGLVDEQMRLRVRDNARRLHRLVEDLLDLDRFGSGGVEPVREDVRLDVVARAVADAASADHARQLVVDVPPVTVHVDPRHLERVLRNLVDNACRYAPTGPVHVEAAASPRGERVALAVEDHGDGIAVARREQVFTPFERGEQVDHASPGVGIGLALVRRLCAVNDATCWVEDGPRAGGARVVLDLPTTAPSRTAPAAAVGAGARTAHR